MKYSEDIIDQLVQDANFREWVKNPDEENARYWNEWIENNPDKEVEFSIARKVVASLSFDEMKIPDMRRKLIWDHIKQECRLESESSRAQSAGKQPVEKEVFIQKRDNRISPVIYRWAAVILLFVAAGTYFILNNIRSEQPGSDVSEIVKSTPKGQKSRIQLSDGTILYLNAESEILYREEFEEDKRIVHLKGEAYFEVARDESRPFSVVSGNITTTALGTSFNVEAYPETNAVKVSLVSGKVKVASGEHLVNLLPGEAASYNTIDSGLQKNNFNKDKVMAWKDGVLILDDDDLEAVIHKLERWYGVKVQVEGRPSEDKLISGRFDNESLENVLKSIGFTIKFNYKIDDREVKLIFNQK